MATNVWVHIIPAQQGLVRSVTDKKPPEEKLAVHAKTRSRHNNYFTYPVVLIMLSNHFSGAYGHKLNWAILAALIVVGVTVRHLQNVYKEISPAILVTALVVLAIAAHSSLTSTSAVDAGDSNTPLTATVPSSKGGPDKVPNESVVGIVKATTRLEGKVPPPKEINVGTCSAEVKGPVLSDTVLAKDGKLQNVFVWIKKGIDVSKAPAAPPEPVVMDQKACMYTPHVVGARVGQKIVFLNSDPVPHNVRTVLGEETLFNEMMQTKGTRLSKVIDKEQVPARAKCDIHPWMSAFVGVVPHPWFAVSSDKGEAELVNVPEGDVEVEAWHEAYGRSVKPVKVKPRESVAVEFVFHAE
jgi:plastocyanin